MQRNSRVDPPSNPNPSSSPAQFWKFYLLRPNKLYVVKTDRRRFSSLAARSSSQNASTRRRRPRRTPHRARVDTDARGGQLLSGLFLNSNTALDNDTLAEFRFKHKLVLLLVGSVKRAVFLIHPIAFSWRRVSVFGVGPTPSVEIDRIPRALLTPIWQPQKKPHGCY